MMDLLSPAADDLVKKQGPTPASASQSPSPSPREAGKLKPNPKFQKLLDDIASKTIVLDSVLQWLSAPEEATRNEENAALSSPRSPTTTLSTPPSSPRFSKPTPYPTTPTTPATRPQSPPSTLPPSPTSTIPSDLPLHIASTFPDKQTRRGFMNYFLEYIHEQANLSLNSGRNTTSSSSTTDSDNKNTNSDSNKLNNQPYFNSNKQLHKSDSNPGPKVASYEANFPSLSPAKPKNPNTSNHNNSQHNNGNSNNQRGKGKRITPNHVSSEIKSQTSFGSSNNNNPFSNPFTSPQENYISAQEERRALVAASKSINMSTKPKKNTPQPSPHPSPAPGTATLNPSTPQENVLPATKPETATAEVNGNATPHEEAPPTLTPTLPSEAIQEHLSTIAEIYSYLILHRLVFSISAEVSLVIRLLTSYNPVGSTPSIFSEWNGPYFSVKVLRRISVLIKGMGPHLSQLMIQNQVLIAFEPQLVASLAAMPVREPEEEINLDNLPYRVPMTSRHHFKTQQEQLVYNNREKMLDAFFQLLREHDPRRTPMTDWESFPEKIADFLTKLHPANMQWFAELFVSILLRDEDFVGEQILDGISTAFRQSEDKLRKLSQRVAPSIGPYQLATFPHLQEFFLKFLLDANHYVFSSQLLAVAVDKLHSLIEFYKEKPKSISLSSYIRQTRILGKFVGLLVVWPYSTQPLTPTLLPPPFPRQSQSAGSGIQLVKETKLVNTPVIDLLTLLREDAKNGNLPQTLPWVVEFLTMLKYSSAVKEAAHYLSAIQLCKDILFSIDKALFDIKYIYRSLSVTVASDTLLQSELFELVVLEEFFDILGEDPNIHLLVIFLFNICTLTSQHITSTKSSQVLVTPNTDVILREDFLRVCFPFLHTICEILKSSQRKGKSSHQKKITPSQPISYPSTWWGTVETIKLSLIMLTIPLHKSPSKGPTPASSPSKLKPKTDPIQAALRQAFFACHPTVAIAREFLLQIVPQNCCTYLLDFVMGMTTSHLDRQRAIQEISGSVLEEILPTIQNEVVKELQPVLRKYCFSKISASLNIVIGAAIGLIAEAVIQRANEICYDTLNIRVRNVCLDWMHLLDAAAKSSMFTSPNKQKVNAVSSSPQQTPPKSNLPVYSPPSSANSKVVTSPKIEHAIQVLTAENLAGVSVTQQASAILQALIADTAQLTFLAGQRKGGTTISPLERLLAPLKALNCSLAAGDISVSFNTLLEQTAGAGRQLLFSHNVSISNVTPLSKPIWDELFSIWQLIGTARVGGKSLCHYLLLPFGLSNMDWDAALSDTFAHLLIRVQVIEAKWREIIESVQLGEASEYTLGLGMCDFIERLFSLQAALQAHNPAFRPNFVLSSDVPPTPPTPVTPAMNIPLSFMPISPTSPFVPTTPTPTTPKSYKSPSIPQIINKAPPSPNTEYPASDLSSDSQSSEDFFESKIKPQFHNFVVWMAARLRGPAQPLVQKRITEIFELKA